MVDYVFVQLATAGVHHLVFTQNKLRHFLDGIPLWEEQLIRYETDFLLDGRILKGRFSVEQNLSVVLLQDPGHMPDDGRFTCAVRSYYSKKITVFTYRPKKGSKRAMGHRQPYTQVKIEALHARTTKPKAAPAAEAAEAPAEA